MATYSSGIIQSVASSTVDATAGAGNVTIYNPTSGYSLFKASYVKPTGVFTTNNCFVQIFDTASSTWIDLFKYGSAVLNTSVSGTVYYFAGFDPTTGTNEFSGGASGFADNPINLFTANDYGVPFIKIFQNMRVVFNFTGSGTARIYYHVINYT